MDPLWLGVLVGSPLVYFLKRSDVVLVRPGSDSLDAWIGDGGAGMEGLFFFEGVSYG